MTVGQFKKFLDNFSDDKPLTFIVDNNRAKVREMYGVENPVVTLNVEIPVPSGKIELPEDAA